MAIRKNTFLVRRSNVAGNVPSAGQLLLGELALNTADVKLYASGTTTNSILPIGWDRISRTGDTMTGSFSAPTISATTYYNLPKDIYVTGGTYNAGTATFTNSSGGTFNVTGFGGGDFVPYTGATKNVDLGEWGIGAGYYQFDLTPTGTPTTLGTMYWDSFNRTAALIDGVGGTTLQLGQEQRVLVHNNTGVALTDGQVVYITGAVGEAPSVALASNTTEALSSVVVGVVTENILNGDKGFVTTSGVVHGLNTLGYPEGAAIWLGSTPGTFTTTKPVSPAHLVLIGYVVKNAGGDGSIFVKVQNTQELDECSDVLFSGLTNNDLLTYETSSTLWKNKSIGTILGGTNTQFVKGDGSLDSTSYTPTSRTLTINGTALDLSANRSWSVGTVTNVSALTIGTSGTDVTSTVVNSTTTPVITLNIPNASDTARGLITTSAQNIAGTKTFTTSARTTFSNGDSLQAIFQNGTSVLQIGSSSNTGRITSNGNIGLITNYPTNSNPSFYVNTAGKSLFNTIIDNTVDMVQINGTAIASAFKTSGGTTGQYVTGAGTLVTFPTIPTVNNGTLSLATSGIATGSASFTANQAGASTFTVNVPATDLSIGSSTGSVVRVDSSTGTDATLPVASATLAGVVTSTDWTTFNNKQNLLNGTGFVKAVGTIISYDNSTYVPTSRTLTINGTALDLSTDRSWSVPIVTANTFNNATYDLTISTSDGSNYTSNLGLLSTDIKVTGGTYDINTGVVTFTNSTGGTFTVTGFSSGMTDTFTTGGTYSNGTATFTRTNGDSYSLSGFSTATQSPITIVNTSSLFSTGLVGTGLNASGVTYSTFIGNSAGGSATNASNATFIGNSAGNGATSANDSVFIGQYAGNGGTFASNSNFLGNNAGYQASGGYDSNFLGRNAGQAATQAQYSNFLGYRAGYQASAANNSNFLGNNAGNGATSARMSNFLGYYAGNGASTSEYSNFIGYQAGNSATNAYRSNIMGLNAGSSASQAHHSNIFGDSAGFAATNAFYSNLIGAYAGYQATNASGSNFLGQYAGYQSTNASGSTFMGYYAGYTASAATNSNFIGNQAGRLATGAYTSNFIGYYAGSGATSAHDSNFIGYQAGIGATGAYNANFLGLNAGFQVTNAHDSNFLGYQAGQNASSAYNSNFLGLNAGFSATNANDSNFMGWQAGQNATGAYNANFFGYNSGYAASAAYRSNFLGYGAGQNATNARYSNFLGYLAGNNASGGNNSNFIGQNAGENATNAANSNFFGSTAGNGASSATNSNFFGTQAGITATNASNSNFLGQNAGYQATNANNSNFLGTQAGQSAASASASNFFGNLAGYNATSGSNSTLIGYKAGYASATTVSIGSNNIIIGTNISLPTGTVNAINLGGVLFGSGTYSTTTGNPLTGGQTSGKIGVNVPTPIEALHVSGNTLINGGLTANTISATTYYNLPTMPTVNDGTLTLSTSGIATGSASFTANQAGASTFTVNVPATNLSLGVSSGTQVRVDSSTGTDIDLPVASATLAGIITTGAQTIAGVKTFSSQLNGTIGSFSQSSGSDTLTGYNGATGGIGINGSAGDGTGGYFVNNSTTYPVVKLLGLSNTRLIEGRDNSDVITFTVTSTGAVSGSSFIKTGGTSAQFLKADGSVDSNGYTTNTGTVTSVAALTIGTSGTNLSSTVANGTTTPVITLNVPTASATNRGALSNTDWTTFNNKQAQINGTGFVKAAGTTISYDNTTYYPASNPNGYISSPGYGLGGSPIVNTDANLNTLTSFKYFAGGTNTPETYFQELTLGSSNGDFAQLGVGSNENMYFRWGTNSWKTLLNTSNYSSYAVPTSRTLTINGTTYDLTANRSWTITATETDTLATVTSRGNTSTGDVNINGELAVKNALMNNQQNTSFGVGTTTVFSRTLGTITAAFFDYVATSGANARAGSVMVVVNGSTVEFTETSTNDIGSTTALTLTPALSGGNLILNATSTSGTWSLKVLARLL